MISIVMPAYNEEQNIEATVRKCSSALGRLKLEGEVVVTDDGSSDNTQNILNSLKKEINNLVVVKHEKNMGYGAALFDAIMSAHGDIIVSIDSDGQFDIDELPLLLDRHKGGFKVVTGFRKVKKDSFMKVFANKCLVCLTNIMFGLKLKDANTAFKLFDAQVLRSIKIESRGYQTPTEIMVKLKASGYPIAEVGVTHSFREKGKSALGVIKTASDMLSFLVYLRMKVSLYRKRIINSL